MSRRDTIIIAILVNAGLLMVLFATALRSPREEKPKIEIAKKGPALQEDAYALASALPAVNEQQGGTLLESIPFSPPTLHEGEIVQEIPLLDYAVSELAPAPTLPIEPPLALAPSSPSAMTTITVKKGDMLEKLARAHQTSVSAIMKANNLSSSQLKIGQVLKIPGSGEKSSETPSSPISPVLDFYIVKEGDSPWLIASKNHVKLDDLLRLNGLDEQKAKKLRPGDKLRIR